MGYTISNLFINRTGETHTGFFGATSGTVHNVGLHNVYVSGANNTGALVGQLRGGTIRNVFSTGSVSGASNVGGLFGLVGPDSGHQTTISTSWTSASVSSAAVGANAANNPGGMIGILRHGSNIIASYATGNVSSTDDSKGRGGLVGDLRDTSVIRASYSTGMVTPTSGSNVGGLVGELRHNGQATNVTYSYWDSDDSLSHQY